LIFLVSEKVNGCHRNGCLDTLGFCCEKNSLQT
jgi:hypothetical protein